MLDICICTSSILSVPLVGYGKEIIQPPLNLAQNENSKAFLKPSYVSTAHSDSSNFLLIVQPPPFQIFSLKIHHPKL